MQSKAALLIAEACELLHWQARSVWAQPTPEAADDRQETCERQVSVNKNGGNRNIATNTARWDFCCDRLTLRLGACKSSCGEHKEGGEGFHFGFFFMGLDLEETVGFSVRSLKG